MREVFKWLLLFLSFLFVVGCGQSQNNNTQEKESGLPVKRAMDSCLRVGILPTLDCLPVCLAVEEHFFANEGLSVDLQSHTAQMDCDTALIGGSADLAFSDIKHVEFLNTKRYAKLGLLGTTNASWELIASKASRVTKVQQLGDKMVGMTRFSATDYLTDQVLTGVKTSSKVFKIQINDVQIRLNMLGNNEIDAAWMPEPQATLARLLKCKTIKSSKEAKEKLGVLAYRNQLLALSMAKKRLALFAKAYNAACDSLNKNGLQYYGKLIEKYCNVNEKVIKALPKTSYSHIQYPSKAAQ